MGRCIGEPFSSPVAILRGCYLQRAILGIADSQSYRGQGVFLSYYYFHLIELYKVQLGLDK